MKKIEILNKIATMTVSDLLRFVNSFDIELEDYKEYFGDLLDDGIEDTPLTDIFSFIELCSIASFLGEQELAQIPLIWKYRIEKIDPSILTVDKLVEIYKVNTEKASKIFYLAMMLDADLEEFKQMLK